MRAFLKNGAGGANGIFDAAETGNRSRAERSRLHDDGVAFDLPVECEMRAIASVENGIVFENHDGDLDSVESMAAGFEDTPSGVKSAETACFAGINGIVGDIPGAAVNDERWSHGFRE